MIHFFRDIASEQHFTQQNEERDRRQRKVIEDKPYLIAEIVDDGIAECEPCPCETDDKHRPGNMDSNPHEYQHHDGTEYSSHIYYHLPIFM